MPGSPAGSSGSGTGSSANVYTPMAQPAADQRFQDTLAGFPSSPSGTPAGLYYPLAQDFLANYITDSPYQNAALDTATGASTYAQQTAFPAATKAAGGLYAGAGQTLNTAYDPQNALYTQGRGNALDAANVANSIAGLGGTPYGASVESGALTNYDLNWQDRQLGRQEKALGAVGTADRAAQGLDTAALKDYTYYGELPYQTGLGIAKSNLGAINDVVGLGNQQYTIPQQVINDLESYLKLGQSASTISGNLGALGLQELGSAASGIGGLASGASSLFGGGSSGSGLLSGLFSGGGTAADFGGGGAALGVADQLGLAGGAAEAGGGGISALLPLAAS